jgi:hypothetical protein
MEGALRKALERQVAYFLEFFRTGRDGQRAKVHQEFHTAASVEQARQYASAMMKFTTFSGLAADCCTIRDRRGDLLSEVTAEVYRLRR